jgi:putative methionine-R-sulfoxide reductase with GAF domain
VATTLVFGEQIAVIAALGFVVREFTLDTSQLDGDDVLDGTVEGIDISPFVRSLSISRGRSDQFGAFRAGTLTLVLNNNDRRFDPINDASPYYDPTTNRSGVTPRRRVQVISGGTTPLFTGRIADIDVEYNYDLSTVTITAVDDFTLLANAFTGADITPSAELSGARVSAILDLPEIAYPLTTRSIDTGVASLGDYLIKENTNAANYLQRVAEAEQGLFFVQADGVLRFTDRATSVFASPVATFADDGTGIAYQGIDTQYGNEFLFNRVQAQTETGVVQAADDAASQTEFGISTLALTDLLLANDSSALTLAQKLLDNYKQPAYRFDDLRLVVSAMSSPNRNLVLGLEMGDVITVTRTFSTGSPAQVSDDYGIERIVHQITPDRHIVTIGLYVAELVFPFVLDDVTFGVLDTDNALS